MPATEPPLDETSWSSPQDIAALPGGLHANTVHMYFSLSPYFDRTSNNGILLSQSMFSHEMAIFRHDRSAFETQLSTMHGIQYLVVQEPSSSSPDFAWIIRKQDRTYSSSGATTIKVLEHYFILGIMVLQAPRLDAVLNARLATVASSLNTSLSLLSKAVSFSPAKGYTWPAPLERKTKESKLLRSRTGTPEEANPNASFGSIESTSGSQMSLNPNKRIKTKDPYRNPAIWIESFRLAARYRDEDMDSHHLVGEPGNFKIEPIPAEKREREDSVESQVGTQTQTQGSVMAEMRRSQTPTVVGRRSVTPKP